MPLGYVIVSLRLWASEVQAEGQGQ